MRQKNIFTKSPTLEEVRRSFEHWRAHKKQRRPIPKSLWEGAVRLCDDHSVCAVATALRLDYNALKRHLYASRPDAASPVTSSDFVALDVQPSPPGSECILEMERAGAKMRMHLKGEIRLYPLELMRVFWGPGR
jgi:hypothetical protein